MLKRWLRRFGLILLLAAMAGAAWYFTTGTATPDTITGEAPRVRDGDTLTLSGKTLRLAGIDAPEYHQICSTADGKGWACGKAARAQLEALALSGPVSCHSEAQDRYGRAVAQCSTPSISDLGAEMVALGLAVPFDGRDASPYTQEEAAARRARRGLWQGAFQSPEDWRRAHSRNQ